MLCWSQSSPGTQNRAQVVVVADVIGNHTVLIASRHSSQHLAWIWTMATINCVEPWLNGITGYKRSLLDEGHLGECCNATCGTNHQFDLYTSRGMVFHIDGTLHIYHKPPTTLSSLTQQEVTNHLRHSMVIILHKCIVGLGLFCYNNAKDGGGGISNGMRSPNKSLLSFFS